ncbi:MAG: glycosyltransferase [Acidimicrobiia bacterium]|nr:glycosyltransferase [Acidimicrobiia bacterium]
MAPYRSPCSAAATSPGDSSRSDASWRRPRSPSRTDRAPSWRARSHPWAPPATSTGTSATRGTGRRAHYGGCGSPHTSGAQQPWSSSGPPPPTLSRASTASRAGRSASSPTASRPQDSRAPTRHGEPERAARSDSTPTSLPSSTWGSLSAEKDVATAVRAVGALDGVRLVVAGDGPERASLERLSAEVARGSVEFLGSVDQPETVLAAADTLVLPSLTEGLPAVLIEAAFTGVPAVATDVGGVREIVRDAETGFVVAPGDPVALAAALRDALAAPSELGERARTHCLARFEIGVVADAWDALIADLL